MMWIVHSFIKQQSMAASFRDVRCLYSASTPSCCMIVFRPLIARNDDHTHYRPITFFNFCRAVRCIRTAYVIMRCLSVCVSITLVDHVKTNKDIVEIFSPSGSHAILVFPHQTGWRYSDGKPPNGGVECRWGRQKSRF